MRNTIFLKRILTIATAVLLLQIFCFSVSGEEKYSKNVYLDLMQTAVDAYTPQRIQDYVERVDNNGINEHGYARLTSNIGLLIANGRMTDKIGLFERMMDICTREIPVARQKNGKSGNDFAVKEVCLCIQALETAGTFPPETISRWKSALKDMVAEDIYDVQPPVGDSRARNWCVYGSASECARLFAGIGGDKEFPDRYLTDQLRFFDENGMYMDPGCPMQYDQVTRLQYMLSLYFGYDGEARGQIEEVLLKSAEPTLQLQSATGEFAFGGRSNQFHHNEAIYASVCEYYASWMKQRGDMDLARRFRAAAKRAMESLEYWTSFESMTQIKNCYPNDSGYGCEGYGYFDKYMVTTASMVYPAFLFADDTIEPAQEPEKPSIFVTTPYFHKIFMNGRDYSLEFDINAQEGYDANGLGRIHRRGAPSIIAISCPCPEGKAHYKLDITNKEPLSISPMWDHYYIVRSKPNYLVLTDSASVWTTRLNRRGVMMTLKGEGIQLMTLPALEFDGERSPEITCDGKVLRIVLDGWKCEYIVKNGKIDDTGIVNANRNGHLRRFDAAANNKLKIRVVISPLDNSTNRPTLGKEFAGN